MSKLVRKSCVPCRGDVPPLTSSSVAILLEQLKDWDVVNNHHLTKTYLFKDFVSALSFVNCIGEVSERENHHPDLLLSWGKVRVEIWTHKIDGLTESDFILAAKIDELRNDG